jgi:glycosyltransferase involved in cell wall biosynthesis
METLLLRGPGPMNHETLAIAQNGSTTTLSVAFVSPGWPSDAFANGVIPYIEKLVGEMRSQGHRATILASSIHGVVDGETVRDLRTHRVSNRFFTRTIDRLTYKLSERLGYRRQSTRVIVDECLRLITEQGLQLLEMEEAFGIARWVRRKLPIPVVVRLHGPWFLNGPLRGAGDGPEFRERVDSEGRAIAEADFITSPSLDVLERTRAYYRLPLNNAVVIPPPTNMVAEADRWESSKSDPNLILFVGRFDLHKGGDVVIEAFAKIASRKANARLCFVGPDMGLVAGDGERLGIEEFIRRKVPDAIDRIEWLGQVPYSELASLRRKARVTVVSSRYETFGLTLTEAMTTGCPTVATRAGAFVEIIEDGLNGLLFAQEDPGDLADKIVTLLEDDELASRLGRRAALDGEQRYAARPLAFEISEHYSRVIRARNQTGRGVSR